METDATTLDTILTVLFALLSASLPVIVPYAVMAFRAIRNERAQRLVLSLIEQLHLALKTGAEASMANGQTVPEVIYKEAVANATRANPDLMKKLAPKGEATPPRDVLVNLAKAKTQEIVTKRLGQEAGSLGSAVTGLAVDRLADELTKRLGR